MYWSLSTKSVYKVHKKSIEEVLLYSLLSMERGFCEVFDIREWWNMQIDAANFCQSSLDEINIETDNKSFYTPATSKHYYCELFKTTFKLNNNELIRKGMKRAFNPFPELFQTRYAQYWTCTSFKNPNCILWFDVKRQGALFKKKK